MTAAESDRLESVRVLLLAHAMVNLKNNEGETACDLASDDRIEELLVSFGAETKQKAKDVAGEASQDN